MTDSVWKAHLRRLDAACQGRLEAALVRHSAQQAWSALEPDTQAGWMRFLVNGRTARGREVRADNVARALASGRLPDETPADERWMSRRWRVVLGAVLVATGIYRLATAPNGLGSFVGIGWIALGAVFGTTFFRNRDSTDTVTGDPRDSRPG